MSFFDLPEMMHAINRDEIPSKLEGEKYKPGMILKKGDQLESIMGTVVEVVRHVVSEGIVEHRPVGGGPEYDKQIFQWKVPIIKKNGTTRGTHNDFGTWTVLKGRWIPRYEDSTES